MKANFSWSKPMHQRQAQDCARKASQPNVALELGDVGDIALADDKGVNYALYTCCLAVVRASPSSLPSRAARNPQHPLASMEFFDGQELTSHPGFDQGV